MAVATAASLIAAPALAVDLSADAMLGSSPEDMTTVKMLEDSAFIGNEVRTKDQIVIGQVEGVYEDADGALIVIVTINGDIASKSSVKSFTVPMPKDMVADGSLTLGWTEAELFVALSSQLEPATKG
ncbi:hypothetical protein [Tabrizicola sp.]|uniref:hypothetical protein n=1 Tax=Tabrizicola sp. TaxID=2005166 RepID=UPI00286BC5CA|nr:hypothetical protein [Tabrizicola sp.]